MAILAGSIITVGGNHVIDRLQSAGLGNVTVPIDTVREIGNDFIVDKVPMEPDFNFQMASMDVSIDLMAWLTGKVGAEASASRPGAGDANGTGYSWNSVGWVNITSPWKDYATGSAGIVTAGHLIPAYFPTKMSYSFGATADSQQTCELAGGEFYYADFAPTEDYATGDGSTVAFVTSNDVIVHRLGGAGGTVFDYVFGVIVNGVLAIPGEDYTVVSSSVAGSPATATITFNVAPALGAVVKWSYFTNAAISYPDTVHTSTIVKPGAVRGRNVLPWIYINSQRVYLYGVQTATLDATVDTTVTRELGSDKIIGRNINGFDVKGMITVQPKDAVAFMNLVSQVTGIATNEVVGYFYQNPVPLGIDIQNPKAPQTIIKTLFVPDAQIQPPGTPARVNTATNFDFNYESLSGTFTEYKGGVSGFGVPGQID